MRVTGMQRLVPVAAVVAVAAAVAPGAASGQGHEDEASERGARAAYCSFDRPSALFGAVQPLDVGAVAARAGQREPSGWKNPPIEEVPLVHQGKGGRGFVATIPVRFHVFTDGATGNLTNEQLQNQITVLNATFAGQEGGDATGFAFKLAGVERIDDPQAFHELNPGTTVERRAKAATHVGDARTLNVWTTNGPTYLGFATFPSSYKRAPELDGVVLDYNSLRGGIYEDRYSLAETGTHEVGHWLGLLHTFQGGCNDKGDYVEDTPAMSVPTSGCPAGKDTCSKPGLDPVRNYMDYSFDSCYTHFTAGQTTRMQDQWLYFRADGGTAVGG